MMDLVLHYYVIQTSSLSIAFFSYLYVIDFRHGHLADMIESTHGRCVYIWDLLGAKDGKDLGRKIYLDSMAHGFCYNTGIIYAFCPTL